MSIHEDKVKKVLKLRAQALDELSRKSKQNKNLKTIVIFKLNDEKFAFESEDLENVFLDEKLVRIPSMPQVVESMINYHGKVICVLDLKRHLAMYTAKDKGSIIIIININGEMVGVMVDELIGIKNVELIEIENSLSAKSIIDGKFIKSVLQDNTTLLKAGEILTDVKTIVENH